jgi:P3 major capsid protein
MIPATSNSGYWTAQPCQQPQLNAARGGGSGGGGGQQMSPQQQNMMARQLILRGGQIGQTYFPPALDVWQPQNPQFANNAGVGSVLTFQVRNVGLVKRLVFRFVATVTAGADQVNLTPWGLANFVSNVTFFDLGNNQRINTAGWHLTAISSAKRRRVFGAAYTSDTPLGYGNNNNLVMFAPASIDADANSQIVFQLEVPFVKNDADLRGAIFSDVTNAVMQVQVTLNPNMFVSNTADPTLAVYQSTGAVLPTLSNIQINFWQNYLDQLPRIGNNPVLPNLDVGTAYLLTNSSSGLPVANQANSAAFVNARTYESVTFAYDNNGTLNVNGSDIQQITLTSANLTNIMQLDGQMIGLMQRNVIMDDFPPGMYYMDYRHRPIDTNQYGNMQLNIYPSAVGGAGAYFLYGWEAFGIIGLVNQGGSIPSGG